jgi:hypothetical protein
MRSPCRSTTSSAWRVDRSLSRLFRTGGMIKVFHKSFDPNAKPSDLIKMLSRVSGLPD